MCIRDSSRTMQDLADMGVASCAVVPVGITKYRKGLYKMPVVDQKIANEILERVLPFGEQCLERFGTRLFFCADELFIKAGRPLPEEAYYEGYAQLENGVGTVSYTHLDVYKRQHQNGAGTAFHGEETDGCQSAEHSGNDGGQQSNAQGNAKGVDNGFILKQICIPMQRESGPYHAVFRIIKRKNDQHQDRRIQENINQNIINSGDSESSVHSSTASSSPSPKRFMIPMQISTTIIIIREIALPLSLIHI